MNSVLQAVLYAVITISSVSALAVALFGSAAALERWLDGPRTAPTRPKATTVARNADAAVIAPGFASEAA